MQSLLSSWAISVTVVILFSAIIDSLLPESSIKKYVKVVLGVMVTLIMLSPLFKLLGGVDFLQEVDNTLNNIKKASEHKIDSSLYKDYIFDVYMDDLNE